MTLACLIVADPPSWPRPLPRPVRAQSVRALEDLLGPVLGSPSLLAAAHALMHRVPRVVLATPDVVAAVDDAALTLWLAAEDPRAADPRPLIAPLDAAAPAERVRDLVAARVTPIAGTGRWVTPGSSRPIAMTAAALALPLHAGAVRELLPTVDVDRLAVDDAVLAAGLETLTVHLGRVVLARGRRPLVAPPAVADPPIVDPLAAALDRLVRDHAFRGASGAAGRAALQREALRILREQVRVNAITSFALDVRDEDGAPVIEVAVGRPKLAERVILRIGVMPDRQ